MRYAMLAVVVVAICGCSPVALKREFPRIPPSLAEQCSDLDILADNTDKLSELLLAVTINYSKYHECKLKVETWIEWYYTQQKIFNTVQ